MTATVKVCIATKITRSYVVMNYDKRRRGDKSGY